MRAGEHSTCHFATLTNVPGYRVAALDLRASDDVPDAGHPVSQQSKRRHEQRQNHGAVLGVTVQLLQQAQETQQPNCFQQVDQRRLATESQTLNDPLFSFCHVTLYHCFPPTALY